MRNAIKTEMRQAAAIVATVLCLLLSAAGGHAAAPIEPDVLDAIAAGGETEFWVVLRERADLAPAFQMKDWNARGRFVHERLRTVALQSQQGLRGFLRSRGARYTPFWIVNAVHVTGGESLLLAIAARPEVLEITASRVYSIPQPIQAAKVPPVNKVEWNIAAVGADQAWLQGARGQGIVVANIDTGVQFDHPALRPQYRGTNANGTVSHDYNWFDPTGICPPNTPCDNNGHGTHTMGTMVGDGGSGNQIGVAPGARWIAAKGCANSFCIDFDLWESGQWILAPWDQNLNSNTDLRPHVVNNSWAGGKNHTWFQGMVQAWIASGIFPVFAVGNSGPKCDSAMSPGDYPESYAVGAFDSKNAIAPSSGKGPGLGGIIKPNIAAPGVAVRSSIPNNGYGSYSGTSMAAPHVAGAVALLWSARPTLERDIKATRLLLDNTAIDMAEARPYLCGGDKTNNNTWGQGRLDVPKALLAPLPPN